MLESSKPGTIGTYAPLVRNTPQTLALRTKAVNLLNARLRKGVVDNECITSVAFFAFAEVRRKIVVVWLGR